MSRVSIKEIVHSDSIDVADPNETLSSWETASGDVGAVNVREEGLDGGALIDNSVQLQFQTKSTDSYQDVVDQSYTLYPITVGSFEAKFDDVFDMSDSTSMLIIRASLEYAVDPVGAKNAAVPAESTLNSQPIFNCVFRYSTDAHSSPPGTWNSISATERKYGFHDSTAEGQGATATHRPFEINPDGVMMRGTHTVAHHFTASSSATVTIGLFAKITQGDPGTTQVRVRDLTITAEKFGR